MIDEEAQALGERAVRELTITKDAFAKLREALLEEIASTGSEQVQKREMLYLQVKSLSQIRNALMQAVSAGQLANHRLILAEQDLLRP